MFLKGIRLGCDGVVHRYGACSDRSEGQHGQTNRTEQYIECGTQRCGGCRKKSTCHSGQSHSGGHPTQSKSFGSDNAVGCHLRQDLLLRGSGTQFRDGSRAGFCGGFCIQCGGKQMSGSIGYLHGGRCGLLSSGESFNCLIGSIGNSQRPQ